MCRRLHFGRGEALAIAVVKKRREKRERERVAASLRRVPTGIDRNYVPYDTIEENLLALDFHH
jgi:hypothetical protein